MAKKNGFAQSISKLEEIVAALEKGDVPLEDAIELYKEGMTLSKSCHSQLEKAEKQLVTMMDEEGIETQLTNNDEKEA